MKALTIMEAFTTSICPPFDQWLHILEILTKVPSDPTNGAYIDEIGDVAIDVAYGGRVLQGRSMTLHTMLKSAKLQRNRAFPSKKVLIFTFNTDQSCQGCCRFQGLAPVVPRCWRETHRSLVAALASEQARAFR